MSAHIHSFAERHPEQRDTILGLAKNHTAFNDICSRFANLWDCLNEVDPNDEGTERMRKEVRHLEAEMLAMFHDQMRV